MKVALRILPVLAAAGALTAWGIAAAPSKVEVASPLLSSEAVPLPAPEPETINYIEIKEGCGPYFAGTCINARSGPGIEYPSVLKLRTGMLLAVATTTVTDAAGTDWYKVVFTEWIRYPNRLTSDLYVAKTYAHGFSASGSEELETALPELFDAAREVFGLTSRKSIVVDRSEQKLYAYENDVLFMEVSVSTGLDLTPTPRGTFTVYRKTPSRYMQGPLPGISDQYYDLPGVPWNLYFTEEGGAIHGAYWHDEFGTQRSHGCVNLPLDAAQTLYEWTPLGTAVLVQD